MKIVDVKLEKIRIQLSEPFRVAFAVIDYSENVLVKMITDEGIAGYGEAAPLAFVTGETIEGVIAALQMFRQGLIGEDPLNIERIHALMNGAIAGNTSAKCAIDLALYDIRGKVMGQPVYKVLGGYENRVVNDITIGMDETEEMVEKARRYVQEDGYHILKIKTGSSLEKDIENIHKIREAVGSHIRLRVDANQGYSVSDAVKALDAFEKAGVEAVEQCLPDWDMEGASFIRKKARGIKVMLDESIHSPIDAAKACRLGAADTLNIKLMKCGGLYQAEQINAIAMANGVNCMVGCMLETKLAITAGLSLVASKQNITEADCDSFLYYKDESTGMSGGFTREGDIFTLSEKPGFGLDINF